MGALLADRELIRIMQARVARVAVGPSTVRGYGAGVVAASQNFLARLKLEPIADLELSEFPRKLDRLTLSLIDALPPDAQHWGLARKVLNIGLRDIVYARHLCAHYPGLAQLEPVLELPLDGIVGKRLREQDPTVPRWKRIKDVSPDSSRMYQQAASCIAKSHGIARIHLDALWWGVREA
jgi:hypothetical protein